ncbi:MAG: ribose-phosphate diphosphokinase [Gammaproteobacteria bacterium]|nr:ribose-phosphate diphosphokinase [Gammaproteobacteria bacterium]
MESIILGFSDYDAQGRRLAQALGSSFSLIGVHRFPDGESRVTLPAVVPEHVILCRSLDHPNAKLVELLLAAETARELGARRITLVAPYLCYMRQDIAFNPGEAVSQRIIGRFLAGVFDALITVDPHLHRIHDLVEITPGIHARSLSCAAAMGDFLRARGGRPLLVGPDSESEQWVRAVARYAGLDYAIAHKERLGDREVRIRMPEGSYRDLEVVLVDDMASTGRTMIGVAEILKAQGAGPIHSLVTHALHDDEAERLMHAAGIEQVWSSDSITHTSNAVSLTDVLAGAVKAID